MTEVQLQSIKHEAQELLNAECKNRDFKLRVSGEVQEDDWVYLVVEPDRPGVHSEDYVSIARAVEKQLEHKHSGNILIVPARPQD